MPTHQAFALAALLARQEASRQPYLEFLRVPHLSAGLYVLPAGAVDNQTPHTEDEVYVVLSGRGQLQVEDVSEGVGPGSVCFVPANARHAFHSVREELHLLVVFAPAERLSSVPAF
jgi:mannose-6-phosphate isomerase-like protein (cupin superfamily)